MATLAHDVSGKGPQVAVKSPAIPLSTPLALVLIAAVTIGLRLGSLWTEKLDWDEWSFILMGADVARGHLPFVHQFDLKPPLIFFLFGATIALFGKSLVAIRLLGVLCVFTAASFVFLTGRRVATFWPALAGALLTATLASAPYGLATSSELPAIAFLAAATWCLTRRPLRGRDAAIAGVLIALAVLCRTNLVLVAIMVGALLVIRSLRSRHRPDRLAWLAFGAAGMAPPAALVLAYATAGQLATLKLAMVDVPLAYSDQLGAIAVARQHVTQFYYTAQAAPLLYVPVATLVFLSAICALIALRRRQAPADAWWLLVLVAITGSVAASLLIGGAAYPHYWLQPAPFAGLLATLGIARFAQMAGPLRLVLAVLVVLPVGSGLITSLSSAPKSYASPHDAKQAASYIERIGGSRSTVWALHEHLVLWYLDAPQLSRAGVHPDNLARRAIIDTLAAHGYVGPDEVGRLMALRPAFVVTDAGGKGLAWVRADGRAIDPWLRTNYRGEARFGDVLVYRRR